ncbi:zinc-binding dehydrogenase [Ralstonia pickettii]|jgi:NADPH2:quinone reductase|nr:hypothetical protein [Ralstonia insidiosa]MBX3775550.1 zinc-binding dehydrogenase [Ralstonia pickettii]NOZ15472.1 zinc-binding dehydrogenase [Betaproteobacteria bacterium]MBA9873316.1 hypothetical protein [Ralstonia insidiosa]MBA9915302.1 hypothetical protein [Ralstonia insidiosa]
MNRFVLHHQDRAFGRGFFFRPRLFAECGDHRVNEAAQLGCRPPVLPEYGALSTGATAFPLFPVLGKQLTVQGYQYKLVVRDPAKLAAAKQFILDGLASGALKPVIDRVFPLEQIVEAHRYLESNQQFGKIVVTV